jgi:hypothetical protein
LTAGPLNTRGWEEESIYEASIIGWSSTLKGANTFEEVTDGSIELEGPLFRQRLSFSWPNRDQPYACRMYDAYLDPSSRNLEYESWPGHFIKPDDPLCKASLKDGRSTVRRLVKGEQFAPFDAPVYCFGLGTKGRDLRTVLILGLSVNVPGAFERLGLLQWESDSMDDDNERWDIIDAYYKTAERRTIRIVQCTESNLSLLLRSTLFFYEESGAVFQGVISMGMFRFRMLTGDCMR